jgi:hypothetical protein
MAPEVSQLKSAGFGPIAGFREAGLPWRLLLFSLFLFGFSLFIFLGLRFGYGAYLDAQSEEIDGEITTLAGQVSSQEQENLVRFYSQLVNLETVLNRHGFAANTFSFLEANTVGAVHYTNASLGVQGGLSLIGETDSLETLVGQLAVFDRSPDVSGVALEQVSLVEGGVSFGVQLVLKRNFFERGQ